MVLAALGVHQRWFSRKGNCVTNRAKRPWPRLPLVFSAYSRAARMVLEILPAIPRGAHPKRGRGSVEIINGVATPTRPGARPPHSTHLPANRLIATLCVDGCAGGADRAKQAKPLARGAATQGQWMPPAAPPPPVSPLLLSYYQTLQRNVAGHPNSPPAAASDAGCVSFEPVASKG